MAVLLTSFSKRRTIVVAVLLLLLFPSVATSLPTGIGGQQNDIDDVAKEGCLCHNAAPANNVQVILDSVPYAWTPGETYDLQLHIIGGPAAGGQYSAGFAMRVSGGELGGTGVDNSCEFSGAPAALNNAIQSTRMGGYVNVLSVYGNSMTKVPMNDIVFRYLHLKGINGRKMWSTWDLSLIHI